MKEKLEDSLKYKQWRAAMHASGNTVQNVQELSLVHKPNGELLFALLHADMQDAEGHGIPPVVMLRGAFVVVVTAITVAETGEEKLLLVKQRRVADGHILYEHPAGMCDSSANPLDVAMRELEEETGLTLPAHAFVRMNDKLLFSSPGLLDEGGWFFYAQHTLSQQAIDHLLAATQGKADEHEFIRLHMATPAETLQLSRNIIAIAATHMYMEQQQAPI